MRWKVGSAPAISNLREAPRLLGLIFSTTTPADKGPRWLRFLHESSRCVTGSRGGGGRTQGGAGPGRPWLYSFAAWDSSVRFTFLTGIRGADPARPSWLRSMRVGMPSAAVCSGATISPAAAFAQVVSCSRPGRTP